MYFFEAAALTIVGCYNSKKFFGFNDLANLNEHFS